MTRELTLYSGDIALVDDDVYDRVSGYRWLLHKRAGTARAYAYRVAKEGHAKQQYSLQREVAQGPPGMQVRFRNGNGLDCRRDNLVLREEGDEQTPKTARAPTPRRRADGYSIGPVNPGRDVAREVRGAVEDARQFIATVFRGWETYKYDRYADSDDWNLAKQAALDIVERIDAQFAERPRG